MPRPKKDSLPSLTTERSRAVIKLGGQTFDCGTIDSADSQKRADQLLAVWLMLGRPDFAHDSPLFSVTGIDGGAEVDHGQIALAFLSVLPDALLDLWSDNPDLDASKKHLESLALQASDLAYGRCEALLREFVLSSLGNRNGNGRTNGSAKRPAKRTKSVQKPGAMGPTAKSVSKSKGGA